MDEKQKNYELALEYMQLENAIDDDYLEAAELFELAGDYKDAAKLAMNCKEMAEAYRVSFATQNQKKKKRSIILTVIIIALFVFGAFAIKTGPDLIKCAKAGRLIEKGAYHEADEVLKNTNDILVDFFVGNKIKYKLGDKMYEIQEYERARRYFADIEGYLDSLEKENEARYMIATVYFDNKDYENAYRVFANIPKYRDCADKAELVLNTCYDEALEFYRAKDYKSAYKNLTLECMKDYKQSNIYSAKSSYLYGMQSFEDENYEEAIKAFKKADNYEDSVLMINEANYQQALVLLKSGDYSKSRTIFLSLDSYKESQTFANECRYLRALEVYESGDFGKAYTLFESLGSYKDSAQYTEALKKIVSRK